MITHLNGITGPAEAEGTVTVNFVTDNIPGGIDLPDATDMTDCDGTVNIIPDNVFGGIDLNLTVTSVSDCNVIGTPNLDSDVTGGIDLLTGDSIDDLIGDSMGDLSVDLTGVPGSLDLSVISDGGNDNVTGNKSFEVRRKEEQRKKSSNN